MKITTATHDYISNYEKTRATSQSKKETEELNKNNEDKFVKSEETEKKPIYGKIKKLTSEQIKVLKEEQAQSQKEMLKKMIQANLSNQANAYGMSEGSQNIIREIFGSLEEGIPPLATTPEEAKKAIEEGGAYSIGAVAARIMKMAKALGENDPEKIGILKDAVKQGFKQAGMDFEKMSGQKLPQICLDTYDEVMRQFDEWDKENTGAE
ncbi:hypothetical protein [Cellulosilyticum sp. I15G10I2]|uniref:hypothetical protein n=1 Tax=Cellulosilyticum sp. I15G10I2 TaxID=1892843 RepID=UPI00085C2F7B|nr:hypothetical protein [Cellulosilyticum sp. I15G10I2]